MSKLQLRSKRRSNHPNVTNDQENSPVPSNKKPKKTERRDESDSESSSDEFVRPSKDLKYNTGGILPRNEPSLVPDFSSIEKSIFSGVSKLSDSDSDDSDFEEVSIQPTVRSLLEVSNEDLENPVNESKDSISSKEASQSKVKDVKPSRPVRNLRSKGVGATTVKSEPNAEVTNVKNKGRTARGSKKKPLEELEATVKLEPNAEVGAVKNKGRTQRCAKRKSLEEPDAAAQISHGKLKRKEDMQEKNVRATSSKSVSSAISDTEKIKSGIQGKKKFVKTKKNETSEQSSGKSGVKEMKEVKEEAQANLDSLDIAQLLALGEGLKLDVKSTEQSDSDSEEWEEVDHKDIKKHEIPKDGVQITLEAPEFSWRRKKHHDQQACMQAEMNRAFNRVRRELQLLCHKASLLLWLAHGIFVNRVISSESVLAIALSLIPTDLSDPPKAPGRKYVDQLLKWFVKDFECSEGFPENVVCSKSRPLTAVLEQHFCRKYAKSTKELTFMFVAILRAVGVDARLVISFQPMPLKPQSDELLAIKSNSKRGRSAKKELKDNSESEESASPVNKSTSSKSSASKNKMAAKSLSKDLSKAANKSSSEKKDIGCITSNSVQKSASPTLKKKTVNGKKDGEHSQKSEPTFVKSPAKTRGLRGKASKKSYAEVTDSDEESSDEQPILSPDKNKGGKDTTERLKAAAARRLPSNRRFSAALKTAKKSTEDSGNDSDFEPKPEPKHVSKRNSGAGSNVASASQKGKSARRSHSAKSNSDSDFESKPKPKQGSRAVVKKSPPKGQQSKSRPASAKGSKGKGMKVLSSDDDSGKKQLTTSGFDYWIEVYLNDEERWTCLDVLSKKIDSTKVTLAKATQPVCYVMAYNVDSTLKDVTKRYAPRFSQVTMKQRVSAQWWDKTLKPFLPKKSSREVAEDSEMNLVELDRPMPKSVGECKNHPLYVLKRHLLKFEAIYPPDSPSLGFVRNEPLYARQNVYTLHSRELWIKEAKVVRPGEEPYKIVKARPKYDRLSGKVITDLPLEVFGPWQVEDYVPPPAVDGKVPRNAYGNVELFKPTMLPKGCVHLQVPSLSRVAKKLHIDCAPAVVGFDYHSGGSHPTFDGFVVCEEYVDVLMDAWNRDIDESAKRREEKHEKRIYGNWRRLIKGLLIREQLKFRYDFNGEGEEEAGSSQSSVNPEALQASRISAEAAPLPSLFPKLMANIRAQKSQQRKSSTKAKKSESKAKNTKGRKAAPRRKRKDETSEEEESDWDSSTTEEEPTNMVLLSDEDSGSEFEDLKQ